MVRPETVLRWHRQGWRLFWRWRSGRSLGRPRLKPEVRTLIATMARENPHWGTECIRGELLKLGIAVSARSIRRHRRRGPAGPPSQSWRTFLANHTRAIWEADLFVVQTLTFQTLYVLFLISHDRRLLLHFNVTSHPTAAWVWRQMIETTPWGQYPSYLVHDRDRVYGADFATRLAGLGIQSIRTPVRSPLANAIAERVVRTLRRECLDHIPPLSEQHVRSVLAEFVAYYNRDRPHPIARSGDSGGASSSGRRGGGISACPRRSAPRLRTSCLIPDSTFAALQLQPGSAPPQPPPSATRPAIRRSAAVTLKWSPYRAPDRDRGVRAERRHRL